MRLTKVGNCLAGLRNCPKCKKNQRPIVRTIDSAGYANKVECKYCGEVFMESENPPIAWNKGMSKYASEEERRRVKSQRATKWNKEHPERFKANLKKYKHSKKGKETLRRWNEDNEGHLKEYRRKRYAANREAYNAARRDYSIANQARIKMSRLRQFRALKENANDERHGSHYGYCLGCRCEKCKESGRIYSAQLREKKKVENGA